MTLNIKKIAKLTKPGRYGDGRNLYLQVTKSMSPKGEIARSWLFRFERDGRERFMGLGSLSDFGLEEARARARAARQMLRDGLDPLEARAAERAAEVLKAAKRITFETAAREYYKAHEQKWSNETHRRQFFSSLNQYVLPKIGQLPVAAIDTTLVLEILRPIWYDMTVTANRIRNRIEVVLDWCTASGYRTGPNPAAWRGHLEAILPPQTKIAKVEHLAAMPYADVPALVASLGQGIEAKALEFLILCSARSNEVLKAKWPEIDFDAKVWTVPASRMKMRKEHRVPLSDRAVELLKSLPRERDFIFIGARKGTSLGRMSMRTVLAALGHKDITVHGFRSSFRDWAAERTSFPRDIIEQCLAHKVGSAVEQAYMRTDQLVKRRRLMEAWMTFCKTETRAATVTPIRKRALSA